MLVDYHVKQLGFEKISNSVTLVPRLAYSVNLLDDIVKTLKQKREDVKQLNKFLVTEFDEGNEHHVKSLNLERTLVYSLDVLGQIQKKTRGISSVINIPEILPSSIPLIRTISAQLFDVLPDCSQKLSELSVHLGSVVLDSASLTKATFDFNQSNDESANILDEVKLMADSKISKQYPNVDFLTSCNT